MSNTKYPPLSPLQRAVAEIYAGGDFSDIQTLKEANEVGDTLFGFLVNEVGDAGDDASEAIRMIKFAAWQLTDLADSLQAREEAKVAADAANDTGPKLEVRFHPQAWQNDNAVEVDAGGDVTFQVPLSDINGGLPQDNSTESDDLRQHPLAPKWIQDWEGPFYIKIINRDEIETHLKNDGVKPKSPKPLAKKRSM